MKVFCIIYEMEGIMAVLLIESVTLEDMNVAGNVYGDDALNLSGTF